MMCDDTTKRAAIYLLSRGQATIPEIARITGRSRQLVRHWAKEFRSARGDYLDSRWAAAIKAARARKRRLEPEIVPPRPSRAETTS